MLKEIIKPTEENFTIKIPKEYVNKELEVIIIPYNKPIKKKKILFGSLNKFARPELIEKEKEIAWNKVIKEKNE